MEPKRLYRDTTNKVLGGVCSGLGNYFNLDPLLIRLVFVAALLAAGTGVLLYIILWIAMPDKPWYATATQQTTPPADTTATSGGTSPEQEMPPAQPVSQPPSVERKKGNLIGGLILISLGSIFLIDEFLPHIGFSDLWPIILVVIGIGLLVNGIAGKNHSAKNQEK